jgi:hypothetical protein
VLMRSPRTKKVRETDSSRSVFTRARVNHLVDCGAVAAACSLRAAWRSRKGVGSAKNGMRLLLWRARAFERLSVSAARVLRSVVDVTIE